MSQLERREPRHWHNESGTHRMPDPRRFEGYPRKYWDEDERYYVAHLERHEAEALVPTPRPDDSGEIQSLFEVIAVSEKKIETARALIRAKRLAEAEDVS
jgi:hypothetical protein